MKRLLPIISGFAIGAVISVNAQQTMSFYQLHHDRLNHRLSH